MAFGSARAAATSSIDRSLLEGAMEHALRVEGGRVLYPHSNLPMKFSIPFAANPKFRIRAIM